MTRIEKQIVERRTTDDRHAVRRQRPQTTPRLHIGSTDILGKMRINAAEQFHQVIDAASG